MNKVCYLVGAVFILLAACNETNRHIVYWDKSERNKREQGLWLHVNSSNAVDVVQHGVWKAWYKNGVLRRKIRYKKGQPIGIAKFWHTNGILQQIVEYNDCGMPHGVAKWWNKDGVLLKESLMKNGTGTDYYFSVEGRLLKSVYYSNGLPQITIDYKAKGEKKHY